MVVVSVVVGGGGGVVVVVVVGGVVFFVVGIVVWGGGVKWCVVVVTGGLRGTVIVVGLPSAPIVVVTITGVVVVVAAVVDVTPLLGISGRGLPPWLSPLPLPSCCWMTDAGLAGGFAALDAVTVASVAIAVASTTPEPARMTMLRDFQRSSPAGAIWSGPVSSVTTVSLHDPVSNG